ncbi:MAG TPA: FtsQ-type POTRA domain-containing protein [Terriglobales bacterium]|nr:FtsQ-type POTRA domain-containing protein [Terriglobales bacterium]
MARKTPTITQDELYSPEQPREELDDARVLDLDVEQESPFLRGQKRVSVRRGSIPKKTATRITWAVIAAAVLLLGTVATAAAYHYGEHSWRFRVESSDDIEVTGLDNVTKSQVMEVMGGDIGRNIFFVPLAERQGQLDQIPWVESASVMRFVPNRIEVRIHERTPIAFARVGQRILLVDKAGTLMELPPPGKRKFSFPVILGMNSGEPQSTRTPRMKIYNDLISQLDSTGARYSQELSEVDLSDPEDVKIVTDDPMGAVLVHLGSSNYLDRYKVYKTHLQEWREQFDKLESVDLRYDRQIIVNPDLQGTPRQPALSARVSKAALSAGVKQAALVTHERVTAKPLPPPVPAKATSAKKNSPKPHKTAKASKAATHPVTAQAMAKPSPVASKTSSPKTSKPSPEINKPQGPQ